MAQKEKHPKELKKGETFKEKDDKGKEITRKVIAKIEVDGMIFVASEVVADA